MNQYIQPAEQLRAAVDGAHYLGLNRDVRGDGVRPTASPSDLVGDSLSSGSRQICHDDRSTMRSKQQRDAAS